MFGGILGRRGCRVATVRPVIAAIRRQDTSQPFGVLHGLKIRLERGRSYIRELDDKGSTRWCRIGGAAIWSSGTDEGSISNEQISLNGEILSRCDSNAVSESACKAIVQDGTRGANICAKLVHEPRLRPDGDANSMQPVRSDDAYIGRRQT